MSSATYDAPEFPPGKDDGALERLFRRPFFLSFTIGIPFCLFKLLFGLTAVQTGMQGDLFLLISGSTITLWALGDLMMNTGRSALDLLHRPASFEFCIIAQIGRIFHKSGVFLALDTLLTFVIICIMLWSGWITRLTLFEQYLWYAATTLNLISLSVVSLYNEMRMS